MILLLISLALATPGPDAPRSLKGVEVPNAIVRQHNAYALCQDGHFDIRRVHDQESFIAEADKAINACKDRKATLMRQAEKVLASAPDYADEARRQRAISEAFDGYDEMRREMARAAPR